MTQSGYPPGSTFKVVTAMAAIDSRQLHPESASSSGRNGKVISGVPLNNFGVEEFGPITLTDGADELGQHRVGRGRREARQGRRCRSTWAASASASRPRRPAVRRAARPRASIVRGHFVAATNGAVDVGRMAIGQDKLRVTPLQMAMVAAAVANDGMLVTPHLARPDHRPRRAHRATHPRHEKSRGVTSSAAPRRQVTR